MTLHQGILGECRSCGCVSRFLLLDDHRCSQCRATSRQEEPLRPVLMLPMKLLGVGVGLILLMLLVLWMLSVIL